MLYAGYLRSTSKFMTAEPAESLKGTLVAAYCQSQAAAVSEFNLQLHASQRRNVSTFRHSPSAVTFSCKPR